METVLRVFTIYVFITFCLRIIGKRELGELSPHELVMIMLIPELATQALSRQDYSITNAFIGISTLLSLVFINSVFNYRFEKYRDIIEGKSVVLREPNRYIENALHRERVDVGEILSEVRAAGFENIEQIKWVVLEPDGRISCVPHEHGRRSQVSKEKDI